MEELDDVGFLKDEDRWPAWPVCPVKRDVNHDRVCGLVFAGDGAVVRILNMFRGWTPEEFETAKKFEYETMEALVADGWEVD